eukprot:4033430-Alexandrium_andersonii.AAC.1
MCEDKQHERKSTRAHECLSAQGRAQEYASGQSTGAHPHSCASASCVRAHVYVYVYVYVH